MFSYVGFFYYIRYKLRLTNKGIMKKRFNNRKRLARHDFYLPGCPEGVKVPDSSPFALEKAMKYLKKQLKDSEKILRYKSKKEYVKPTTRKRVMMNEAKRKEAYRQKVSQRIEKGYVWTAMTEKGAQ